MFGAMGAFVLVLSVGMGLMHLLTAQGLRRRRWRGLTYVTAALSCLSIPVGTALGVYTFIVMNRPGVRALYAEEALRRAALDR
jgi:hypothetical protein